LKLELAAVIDWEEAFLKATYNLEDGHHLGDHGRPITYTAADILVGIQFLYNSVISG